MSKLLAVGVAGSGVAAAAVGGTYIMHQGNGNDASEKVDSSTLKSLTFEDVTSFQSNMKNSGCVSENFKDISAPSSIDDISSNSPESNIFFKNISSATPDPYKSCLVIEGKVTSYKTDSKWSGKLTGLWTFVRGDEGFITFNVLETSDQEANKFKVTGIFYLVGKNGSNWEVKYKKQAKENLLVSADQVKNNFPKEANDLKDSADGEGWGFVDGDEKFSKACKTSECGEAVSESPEFIDKKLTGIPGTDQNKKLDGGSSVSTGGSKVYDGSNWNLEDKIGGFYGTGEVSNNSGE